MPIEIRVPDLGESVVEATVARWHVREGERVQAGQALVTLETDKVDLDIPAERDGVVVSIQAQAGQDVKVGDVLALLEPGEAAGEATTTAPEETATAPSPPPQAPAREEAPAQEEAPAAEKAASAKASAEAQAEERVTPVARRLAQEAGVDVSQIQGTGPGGRVTKEDVTRYLAAQQAEQAPAAPTPTKAPPTPGAVSAPSVLQGLLGRPRAEREERIRMSRRRRTIAQRLVEAQHTAAMLTTFNEIDMSRVIEVRSRWRERFEQAHGVRLGFMPFFVKAVVAALKAFPMLNAEIDGDEIVLKHYYDIGIAVGAEEGLVVPVLRDADRLSFAEIERAIREFVRKAQEGTLTLADLQGGTFTITNGGVFGSLLSTPILNPPQVGILGMHKIQERPVAVQGQVEIRPMMYVALTYDHRIVDGREAVQFLVRVKELVEDPERLLVEG